MAVGAVVFDFDGLILDTETPEYETIRDEFAAHGVALPLEEWQQVVGRVDHPHWLDRLEAALGRPVADRTAVLERRRAAHHRHIADQHVLPGVEALLDEAEARRVPVAVASSSPTDWVEGHLERLGLRPRVAAVRCGDQVPRAKPWPDVFLAALDAVGVPADRAVALEDSHHGSRAAAAAGLACVVVPNPITRGQDVDHADLVVGSLADLRWDDLVALVRRGPAGRAEDRARRAATGAGPPRMPA